ncbi:hypothetical protein [Streptomyces sp. Inha503]|uniref:hypothetical protein n=1 Tax=Streptomyces sp. Inha503 TaxID=3383314 RepID=UPI0039A25A78
MANTTGFHERGTRSASMSLVGGDFEAPLRRDSPDSPDGVRTAARICRPPCAAASASGSPTAARNGRTVL